MLCRSEAERVAHRYNRITGNPQPHRDIEEALRFLADYAINRREVADMRALARYVLEDSTADAELRMLAKEVLL